MVDLQIARAGIMVLGGFHPPEQDAPEVPDGVATLMLIGWAGPAPWALFAASAEMADGAPDPLDRWTRRIVDALAQEFGARALYPFGGPPWQPFQAWALAAGIAHKSPIGLLIHPRYGLWHNYRAALGFPTAVTLPPREAASSPCDTCATQPCLSACPVDAFSATGFAVDACRTHVRGAGSPCRDNGCLARDACPVGRQWRYSPEQVAFHQRAFLGPAL